MVVNATRSVTTTSSSTAVIGRPTVGQPTREVCTVEIDKATKNVAAAIADAPSHASADHNSLSAFAGVFQSINQTTASDERHKSNGLQGRCEKLCWHWHLFLQLTSSQQSTFSRISCISAPQSLCHLLQIYLLLLQQLVAAAAAALSAVPTDLPGASCSMPEASKIKR